MLKMYEGTFSRVVAHLPIYPVYLQHFMTVKTSNYNFRYTHLLDIPISTKSGNNSLSFQAAKLWNDLPKKARKSTSFNTFKKVQVGKDQEKAQSERDSHSKNRGGKKPN